VEAELERRLRSRRPDPELDQLFGAEAHAQLRALALRAARLRGGERVLILPGIMGSTLGTRRDGRDKVLWFNPVEVALGGLARLALPSTRRIKPLGAWLLTYLRPKLELRAAGFDADFHPYDWRRSVADAGRELAARIAAERHAQVHLVAHSMGGLVARAALAHVGADRIGQVVQLGTPNGGAYATVQALRGSYPLVRRLALLDLRHDARDLARKVFTTLPGLAELLPVAAACEDFDPFQSGDWPRGPHPAAALLKAARQARESLPAPDGRFTLIAGVGRDTPTGLRRRAGRLEFRRGVDGDGTVPLALAMLTGLRTLYVEEDHGALPGNDRVIRAVLGLLEGSQSTQLATHWSPPQRRSRWAPEVLLPPPTTPVFWDDLGEAERRDFLHEFVAPAPAALPTLPVRVEFAVGDIAATPAGAIVLGLFENVEPAGAALAVDARLGGAIRALARRRALGAAAGEVSMLPVGRERLPAGHVVFAGLGDFTRYGSAVQQLAAANVARMLALGGIDDYALVLWGTASGVPAAAAAAAQLSGLLEAFAEFDPALLPHRVVLVSRSQRRLAAAREAMRQAQLASAHGALVELGALPAAEGRRAHKAPALAATPLSYLFVHEEGGELRAALLGVTAKATALTATRRLDTRALEQHLATLEEGVSARTVAAFGERLGELLLPESTREALAAVRGAPLVVVHDAACSRWPWETLHVDGWSPAAERGLSRRYAAEGLSVAKWREERRLERTLRVLLVVNPTGDLAGADQEGARVRKLLGQIADIELTELAHGQATRTRLLEAFRSGRYDAIHYAGHAYFDSQAPASSGILCAGGRVLSGTDLAALESVPALVCCNACESARVRGRTPVSRSLARHAGFAEAFLRGGVANFIGTWWPVSDDAAFLFAGGLYESLVAGATLGEAMHQARSAVRTSRSGDWANYLHYGSHDFVLKREPGSA
jgi:hypothetical protein